MQDSISFEFLYIIKIAKFIFVKNDVCFVRGVSFFLFFSYLFCLKNQRIANQATNQ